MYRGSRSDIITACSCCSDQKLEDESENGTDTRSIVISIDGACRGNGRAGARASYGVFWGNDANYNEASVLPEELPQTNQVAELWAVKVSLEQVQRRLDVGNGEINGGTPCKILVLTDSSYVVKGLSEHIWKWRLNGFLSAKRQSVVNGDLFKTIDGLLCEFEELEIPVWFWLVPRDWNRDADRLANMALDGETVGF